MSKLLLSSQHRGKLVKGPWAIVSTTWTSQWTLKTCLAVASTLILLDRDQKYLSYPNKSFSQVKAFEMVILCLEIHRSRPILSIHHIQPLTFNKVARKIQCTKGNRIELRPNTRWKFKNSWVAPILIGLSSLHKTICSRKNLHLIIKVWCQLKKRSKYLWQPPNRRLKILCRVALS